MVHGIVDVTTTDNETWIAAVDAGFLSVANNRISILSEHAEMSHDIDLEKARADLERCKSEGAGDDEALAAGRGGVGRGPCPGGREGVLTLMPLWEWLVDSVGVLLFLLLLYGLAWSSAVDGSPATAAPSSSASASGPVGPGAAGFSGSAATPATCSSGSGSSRWRPGRGTATSAPTWSTSDGATPSAPRPYSLYSGHIIVSCQTPSGPLEVAMSPDALTGFLAWLEAAPPGRRQPPLRRVSRQRSPPGFQSTSPSCRFACRARMNSRSRAG